ncbi:hypothetical protein DNTS_009023 [Danionella cerebrum]|uniref:Leucine-rich repeat-containing protein 61 n=1 Tax=Danionella cerebrum TaxID=2873325 RepID=A0A553QAF5_9TELE|nr:hypothetical protein DNTS_009023 [Danionella translucida]
MDSKRDCGSDMDCTKITTMLLKSYTGEFDLESILFLKLRNSGLYSLGCIGECVNLERLDLSGNNITNLGPLSPLRKLLSLNLSANRISNLGERVVGRGSDLYQLCKDIDDTIKAGMYKNGHLTELSESKRWVEDGFWEIKRSNNTIVDAQKQFSDILHECRVLNSQAAHLISQNEHNKSLKSQPRQYSI